MTQRATLSIRLCAAAGCLIALCGCGEGRTQRVPIAGKVTIDGAPLEQGFVQVIPSGDRAASGKIGPDGAFRLTTYDPDDGCIPGTHKVIVIANESQGPTKMKWFAPKKYANTLTSPLQLTVDGPREDVVIELSWEGGAPFVEEFEDEGAMPPPSTN